MTLVKSIGETKKSKIIKAFKVAYHENSIDRKQYWQLKRLVQDNYQLESNTIEDYKKTQSFLNKQFPERFKITPSDYISDRVGKSKLSRRELLLAKFNQFQIIYLKNMMERLLNRLNADEVVISVFIDDEIVEEVILDPLEQYRFAAKMIRKELGDLANTSMFSQVQVSFEDVLAAAFETALVPAGSLSSLDLVEDIWNPTLTKVEKRKRFIKRYGTIFVAAIPTSVYLVKVLGMVGIEMLTSAEKEPSRDHSIF